MGKINASLKLRSFRLKQKGRALPPPPSRSLLSALEGNHDAAALRCKSNSNLAASRRRGGGVAGKGREGGRVTLLHFSLRREREREREIGISQ